MEILKVIENHLCYSCGACSVFCDQEAITFKETNLGRLHPIIDPKLCINCGICYKICPSLDNNNILHDKIKKLHMPFHGNVISCYVGKSLDERVYQNSQSGGLVTQTLIYLFKMKLITQALVVKMDCANPPKPKYYFANSIDELLPSQKSIYNPVNLLTALKDIKYSNESYAIVGLPCHIEGLEILLELDKKIFNKIKYKIGLICDGLLALSSIDYFAQRIKIKKDFKLLYRDKKNPNYKRANITVETSDGKKYSIDRTERLILKRLLTPPRCNICFNKMNIFADLVYGDSWGISDTDINKGESIVICRTEIGEKLIHDIRKENMIDIRSIKYDEITKGQRLNEHIKRTFTYFEAYKKVINFYPKYLESIKEKLPVPYSNLQIKDAVQYIKKFLLYETFQKNKIVNMLLWEVRKRKLIYKFKSKIKKLLSL